jgi:hypothetical protein
MAHFNLLQSKKIFDRGPARMNDSGCLPEDKSLQTLSTEMS